MSRSDESRMLRTMVDERIDRWREGEAPSAAGVVAEHPEIAGAKSLVMDLVLAEYSLRAAAGAPVERDEFCQQFPAFKQSIAKMLDVQDYLDRCPPETLRDEVERWPRLGEEFLGYKLVEPLGRGGLARVFLARDQEVGGRLVVVKISREGQGEAATQGRLAHASIVPVLSAKRDAAGWTAICMPLVGVATGVDLLDAAFAAGAERSGKLVERVAVETKPLTPFEGSGFRFQGSGEGPGDRGQGTEFAWDLSYGEAVARVGVQLAEALTAAHAAGIMHRDLKPSNVLLAWTGRAMLLDFNLSSDDRAASLRFGGTLAYMAPELLAGVIAGDEVAARQHDPRGDIYSLGAVLFELLTNHLPARPANAERLSPDDYEAWLECKRQLVRLPEGIAVDRRLLNIVLKCLEFNPQARYATGAALAADLRAYLERGVLPARRARRRRRAIIAALVGLTLGGAGRWAYVASRGTSLDEIYEQALVQYEDKRYDEAVKLFTRCLELRPGWPDALFGRAQALRMQGKWLDARSDYVALKNADAVWSHAFAGYCSMRSGNNSTATLEFAVAFENGLRHVPMLFNYARSLSNRQKSAEEVRVYDAVIAREPVNTLAMRNRALAQYALVRNDTTRLPSDQAFVDAEWCCQLEAGSFETACCAAIVFGEAARKDTSYEARGVQYLTRALELGMPIEAIEPYSQQLKPLVSRLSDAAISAAKHAANYRINFRPHFDPPDEGRWSAFQRQMGNDRDMVATNK